MAGAMPEPWTVVALRIGLIALVAGVSFAFLRLAISVSLRHLLERRGRETGRGSMPAVELERRVSTIGRLAVRIAGTVIAAIAGLMILGEFGIDIGPALAGLGVVGIAVGFGAQSLVRDWFAGIFIVIENQYSQGDVVRIAGVEGVVEDFSLRRTTLRDLDGTVHSVPNGQIIVASNLSPLWVAVAVEIGLADRADSTRAADVMNGAGSTMKADGEWSSRILDRPSLARVTGDEGTGARVEVTAMARASERDEVVAELQRRMTAELKEAGIRLSRAR